MMVLAVVFDIDSTYPLLYSTITQGVGGNRPIVLIFIDMVLCVVV